MLRKQNFLYIACKSMLIILCIMCFTSISLAQPGWETKAPMPTARGWFSTSVVNNIIYAVGGATDLGSNLNVLEAFDPNTNTWTSKSPMPTPRGNVAACSVDGIIYVFGGGWYTVYSTVEAYDPLTNTWTAKSPMPTARSGLSVCEVDGIIYAISGFIDMNSQISTTAVEAYDPQTDTWTTKAPIPTARALYTTSVVNGIIYAFGGFNGVGTPSLGNVEAYDPVTDVWTIKNDMANPKAGMTTCTVDGIIYAFGGVAYGGGPCYPTFQTYDPVTDTWTPRPDMPYEVGFHSNSIVNGKIYLIGGVNTPRIPLDIVYEADPELIIPVELVSFTATSNGKEVILNWSTATELNNLGFEVQRKFGSNDFVTVGSVKGQGTITSPNHYSFLDKLIDGGKYFYRLKQIDFDGTFEYSDVVEVEVEVRILDKFTLEQNYPNPFNPNMTIKYSVPKLSFVTIKIYDVLGSEVATLVNEEKPVGSYDVGWVATGFPSGVYFYRLQVVDPKSSSGHGFVETKKMILMK